MTSLFGFATG